MMKSKWVIFFPLIWCFTGDVFAQHAVDIPSFGGMDARN